jgi:type I restriction enzyme S subunit
MGNIENGKVIFQNLAYINIADCEKSKYLVKENELLFNRTNSLEHVGKLGIVKSQQEAVFASYIVRFKVDSSLANPAFIAYMFNTTGARNRLKRLATPGVCQHNINQSDLQRQFEISLPPVTEQKKIAEILSAWDAAIEQARKLIEAKKRRKKALIQQLLTGKTKLKGFKEDNWEIVFLGRLVSPVSRSVSKPDKTYLSIGLRSHCKGTFHKSIDEPEKIMMDTLYRVEPEDLILNITFAWEGAIAFATENDSGGLVSHRFPTYRLKTKIADIEFVRNLILTKRFIWDLGLISPGGAGRNRVMNKKDFLKIKVYVPSIKSQIKIGQVLSTADNEINQLENKLKALEKQKRGLMQKLLTGEIRVIV